MPESPSESLGRIQSIRRSATLPTRLNPQAQRGSSVPNNSDNVIFYHPSARIVHFRPRALAPIPSSSAPSDFDYPVDTIETLPWRSATERTVATAPLKLERRLAVFLDCGKVVHPILKNSQCWCVDGVSKFVLRIGPLTYYRIEIPHETEEDKRLVTDLKAALPTVLRYEVTPCPFKRAFTVELPEEAMAPRRKKAWQPKDRRESAPVVLASAQASPSSSKSEWTDSASTGDDMDGNATDDSGFTSEKASSTPLETIPDDGESPPPADAPPTRPRRSVTETPQTFTSLRAKFEVTSLPEEDSSPDPNLDPERDASFSSSPGSFHSADLPSPSGSASTHPTPVEYHDPVGEPGGDLPEIAKAASEDQAAPDLVKKFAASEVSQGDHTSKSDGIPAVSLGSVEQASENPPIPSLNIPSNTTVLPQPPARSTVSNTDFNHMSAEFRRRAQATRRRDISPMPPASAIYQPPPSQDAASIISKTLTLVLVPPIHLFILLIHIAARIVISPALHSAFDNSVSKTRPPSGRGPVIEDDFSFPLEPEAPSEYEDAETSNTLDPWDLD